MRLLAVTVLPNLLIPVLLTAKSPNAVVPPTIPSKLTLPVPESTVRLLFPSTVLLKATSLFVVFKLDELLTVTPSP